MEQNAAVRMAQKLYEQKNYLAAAQACLELIKEKDMQKQGHLLFTKAFLFLISGTHEGDKINTLYSSAGNAATHTTTLEEYFATELEISEAYEEWTRERFIAALNNLERNPTLDYWGAFINLRVEYLKVSMILTATMRNQSNVKAMMQSEGGNINELTKKYNCAPQNKFTDSEYHERIYHTACKIWNNMISFVEEYGDGSSEFVQRNVKTMIGYAYVVQLMLSTATPKEGKGADQERIERLGKQIEFIQCALSLHIYPNGREMWLLQNSSRTEWNEKLTKAQGELDCTKKAVEKAKHEQMQQRIAAYWSSHSEEKAKLEEESKQLQESLNELNLPVQNTLQEINELAEQKDILLPCEEKCLEQYQLICALEAERDKCGIFKGKQKKQLTERIESVEKPCLEQMQKEAEAQRKIFDQQLDEKIGELQKRIAPQERKMKQINKRIEEIARELTKPR